MCPAGVVAYPADLPAGDVDQRVRVGL